MQITEKKHQYRMKMRNTDINEKMLQMKMGLTLTFANGKAALLAVLAQFFDTCSKCLRFLLEGAELSGLEALPVQSGSQQEKIWKNDCHVKRVYVVI